MPEEWEVKCRLVMQHQCGFVYLSKHLLQDHQMEPVRGRNTHGWMFLKAGEMTLPLFCMVLHLQKYTFIDAENQS